MTPEQAAVEMWRLVGLPKRIFLVRALSILSKLQMRRAA